jgi:hypothetical protein
MATETKLSVATDDLPSTPSDDTFLTTETGTPQSHRRVMDSLVQQSSAFSSPSVHPAPTPVHITDSPSAPTPLCTPMNPDVQASKNIFSTKFANIEERAAELGLVADTETDDAPELELVILEDEEHSLLDELD